jgi:signal transduction histidine kinase
VPANVRSHLLLQLVAIAAACAAFLLGVALPLVAARAPLAALAAAIVAEAALLVALGAAVLFRGVARPVERMLTAAATLSGEGLPALGPPGEAPGPGLPRAALAFERTAAALREERQRVAGHVAALERANRELSGARESLVRSERLATLGLVAAGIAHEVGNPLGAITGYVELARDRLGALDGERAALRAELDDFLARIGDEALRIDRIVRDLLDLARPAEPVLGAVDLGAALDAALRLARVQARFRSVEVELAIPPGLPRVVADERRLSQVFLNLLLNAGDAMQAEGKVRVEAALEGGGVAVRVADGGTGIPAADLPRVFEPFFTTKGAGRGTGLGLAVSQGIVESFGGELLAANAPGGGAVFTLVLRPAGGGPAAGLGGARDPAC